jgi:hypothetical protein
MQRDLVGELNGDWKTLARLACGEWRRCFDCHMRICGLNGDWFISENKPKV